MVKQVRRESAFDNFRAACAALAKRNSQVRVSIFDVDGHPSVNFLENGAKEAELDSEDYRLVHPDWLRPIEGRIELDVRVEHPSGDRYHSVFLDHRGAWTDRECTKPVLKATPNRKSLRECAIDDLGLARIERAEQIVAETIDSLLASPELRKNGFKTRVKPVIVMRWTSGKSHGGQKGIRFALARHASKSDNGAIFKEYAAFADLPMIGSYQGSWEDCLRVLVAHETAHWLQYHPKVTRPAGQYRKPHGTGFQKTYWILRHILGLKANVHVE